MVYQNSGTILVRTKPTHQHDKISQKKSTGNKIQLALF